MRILLVEDDALIALGLRVALELAQHEVLGPVATAARGLALAERSRPGLALVDINLKGRGNGIDLARELSARWGVPSLFVTGQRDEALRNKQVALGYIGKPYRSELVLSSIDFVNELVKVIYRSTYRRDWSCSGHRFSPKQDEWSLDPRVSIHITDS